MDEGILKHTRRNFKDGLILAKYVDYVVRLCCEVMLGYVVRLCCL